MGMPLDWMSVACVLVMASAGYSPAQDYTQWRGRNRDGSASDFRAPDAWPERLTRRWTIDVGAGYGTPVVVGNVVYTFTRRRNDEVMAAITADTGKELWHTGYPAPYTASAPSAAHGSGPKATPAFSEGRLFTVGISGIVAAFDAVKGTLLWRTPAPDEPPFFSAASSPAVVDELVLAHPGNYGPLTAFDAGTGKVKWTAGDDGFFASPLVVTIDGVRQVLTVTQSSVIGVSVADGSILWRHPWPGGGSGGTMPVMYGETVIVSALDVGVAAFRPVRREGTWTTEPVWDTRDVWMYLSNPVVIGDALFGLSQRSSGQYFALDAGTGRVLWLGPPRAAANTAVVKSAELLVLLEDDGELIVAKASRAGFEPIRRYTVSESSTWAQPALSGNRIFVKDVASLTLWTVN